MRGEKKEEEGEKEEKEKKKEQKNKKENKRRDGESVEKRNSSNQLQKQTIFAYSYSYLYFLKGHSGFSKCRKRLRAFANSVKHQYSDSFVINVNVKYPASCDKDNKQDEKLFEGILGTIRL